MLRIRTEHVEVMQVSDTGATGGLSLPSLADAKETTRPMTTDEALSRQHLAWSMRRLRHVISRSSASECTTNTKLIVANLPTPPASDLAAAEYATMVEDATGVANVPVLLVHG